MVALGNRILMVHNDPRHLQDRARHFSRLGFTVTTASTTTEAIEATAAHEFDLAEISLGSTSAAGHLRSYLEMRYRDISVFVIAGGPPRCCTTRAPAAPRRATES